MLNKKVSRLRRARKARCKMREDQKLRLCVHRTPQHIYAQVFSVDGSQVLVTASSAEQGLRDAKAENKVGLAGVVGKAVAERAIAKGIKQVAFDRSGFKYHGRVKALADAAREGGLEF
ncbi:MAG: 50S ribosomal protein L18 [Legionellales bacterium]|nr:50S ribosomal protein L18 [Legionellales bacterium]